MLYLIKKELTANLRYMLAGIGIFVVYMFIFSYTDAALFTMCLIIGVYTVSTTNLVIDERYKIDLLLTSLPIRKRDIVFSKYLLVLVLYIISFVLYTLIAFAGRAAGFHNIQALTLVGAGSQDQALRALSASLHLNNVRFAGAVAPADIWQYYAEADIYVQTPDIDNMPSSVLEAFASGCAVVSTNAGGVPLTINSMTLDVGGTNRTVGGTGQFTVYVGGNFQIAAAQASGLYTANFNLTADYQ
jgi:hypothetical protein